MNLLKQTAHLIHLDVCRPEDFRAGGKVVYNSDGKNFKANQLFQLTLSFFIVEGFSKVVHCVLVFVGKFPPIRTHLADAGDVRLFKTVGQRVQFFVDQDQVIEV